MSMNYKERLKAAADLVISRDHHQSDVLPLNYDEIGIKATLKPHQIEGISWLIQRYLTGVNVILGDEMGLGKTLQAITFLIYLKFHLKSPGPFLVICPLSVTDGWVSEVAKFCPKLRVLRYVGDKEVRLDLRRKAFEQASTDFPFDVLLTTYDIVLMDKGLSFSNSMELCCN
ncbi:probable helicase CHR10 [Papaver somniferum]|uniref:probable helicase CHR10 n=1 Tax=Papaver somniferum TaxID=3469 RepID=UPI000E704648|nr:probable helicase CHR10 [Papaver somniferum]XP_026427223.1 probable helicase CHR10 [Papaver somniferum]XP_026427225.1 probable helicase CHR10 [Papaver somniferum]